MEINGSDSISNKIPATNGAVAQVVEQGTENPRVGGSTPPSPTNGCTLRRETLQHASTGNDISNVIP